MRNRAIEAQLDNLGTLRARIAKFQQHAAIATVLAVFDTAEAAFRAALKADETAFAKVDTLFQEEQGARRAVREQLESANGRLRSFYKARPGLAEQFFLADAGSRRTAKGETPAVPAPPTPA